MARGSAPGERRGGRQKGTPNRRTTKLAAAVQAATERLASADLDAHGLLCAVYRDEDFPIDLRVEAARAALPFEKPRLATIDLGNKDGQPLVVNVLRFAEGA